MLLLPAELSLLPSTSKISRRTIQRTASLNRQIIPLQQGLALLPTRHSTSSASTADRSCSFCSKATSEPGTTAFAYLSKRRQRPVISIAMSTMSKRRVSTPPPSKPPARGDHDHKHDHGHSHSHDGHDHDHSHGGLFHTHVHDHSEGADQIMQAITKGKLDRGTRITLLGEHSRRLTDQLDIHRADTI